MRITDNNNGYYSSQCRNKFRDLPQIQQYKIMDQLITNAERNEDPNGSMRSLAQSLGLRSSSHLNVSLIDAGEAMNKPNAGDGVRELADILGMQEGKVDCALGDYAQKLAEQTNPKRPVYGGGNT